jgi:general stress protein 26
MTENNLKKAVQPDKKTKKSVITPDQQKAQAEGLALVEKAKTCLLGTIDNNGFPNIKAMMNMKHEGLKTIWFSTNTSSRRIQQIKQDKRACVYYVDEQNFQGMMLVGTVDILQDIDSKKLLWSEGAEIYYPLGVEDPDYSVLRFTAARGNYYHGLKNTDFDLE